MFLSYSFIVLIHDLTFCRSFIRQRIDGATAVLQSHKNKICSDDKIIKLCSMWVNVEKFSHVRYEVIERYYRVM